MSRQKLDQRGARHTALGCIEDAVHARQQFLAIQAAKFRGLRARKCKLFQANRRQRTPSAMDGDFDPVGKGVQSDVDASTVAASV